MDFFGINIKADVTAEFQIQKNNSLVKRLFIAIWNNLPKITPLIIGFGMALFFYSLAALFIALLAVPIMIWSIIDEEKQLIKQYSEEYKKYMRKVPWRIIPKIF